MATISTSSPVRLPLGARRRAEDLLCRAGVYGSARNAYQRVFNRAHYATRRRDLAFFRAFVPAGGLVFDVGANEGRMTQTFAELGATVVAVEPNPALSARVRARYASRRVTVEPVAIGDVVGTAELHLGRDNGHSTLSSAWQDAVGEEGGAARWDGSVRVPVTTLDALIERHGRPDFVKIDVEGFEPNVLAGLHQPVPALSFEFLCAAIGIARTCVERVAALGDYEFNLARGEEHLLPAGGWSGADALLERLERLGQTDAEGYGDVYARLRAR